MYQKEVFKELIDQFISGEITSKSKEMLLAMMDNPQYSGELNALLKENYETIEIPEGSDEETKKFIEELRNKTRASKKVKKAPIFRLFNVKKTAIAASIIVVMGIGALFCIQKNIQSKVVFAPKPAKDKEPAKNGAILTLADGSTIVLDSLGNGLLTNQNNTSVSKKNGSLVYKSGAAAQAVYNTITTPRGRQFNLVLSDGTKVWLNASSSITFPTSFESNTRKVSITGEAYFEVFKNKTKPFTVAVNGMKVNVVGTHFNINAYADETAIKTTLLEGSVILTGKNKSVHLKPGQQGKQIKSGEIVVCDDVNLDEVMSWKSGIFYFDNASLQTVLRQISRWYDIDVVFDEGVSARTFEGEIQTNLKLSQVLKILEKNQVHFKIEEKFLRVMP